MLKSMLPYQYFKMKRSIKKKEKRKEKEAIRKPIDYDYQNINKTKLAGVFNIIGVIHITFQYK
jgi:hypothetical protein